MSNITPNHDNVRSFGFTILDSRSTRSTLRAWAETMTIDPVSKCPLPKVKTATNLIGSMIVSGAANSNREV